MDNFIRARRLELQPDIVLKEICGKSNLEVEEVRRHTMQLSMNEAYRSYGECLKAVENYKGIKTPRKDKAAMTKKEGEVLENISVVLNGRMAEIEKVCKKRGLALEQRKAADIRFHPMDSRLLKQTALPFSRSGGKGNYIFATNSSATNSPLMSSLRDSCSTSRSSQSPPPTTEGKRKKKTIDSAVHNK
jgi:hypothetical protein